MTMRFHSGMAAFAMLLSTTGCMTYSLEELRHATPTGSPFQTALSKHYLDFATREEKEYDWFDSMHFADKGLRAAYGKDTQPEELARWKIPDNVLPDLQAARKELMAALAEEATVTARPQLAADAQFYFDCWVEEQEENWQAENIAFCRTKFGEAIAELTFPLSTHAPGEQEKTVHSKMPDPKQPVAPKKKAAPKSTPKPVAKPAPKAPPAATAQPTKQTVSKIEAASPVAPETLSYVVFFEKDRADLTESGRKVVQDVAVSLKNTSNYHVVLRGTDANDASRAAALAQERARTVKHHLAVGGVDADAVSYQSPGGPSASAHAEAQKEAPVTKKVEIFLNE